MNTITELDKKQLDMSQLSSVSQLETSMASKIDDVNAAAAALRDSANFLYYMLQLSSSLADTINNQVMAAPCNNAEAYTLTAAYKHLQELSMKIYNFNRNVSSI